jgi:two-component system, NarL family, sensor kinase
MSQDSRGFMVIEGFRQLSPMEPSRHASNSRGSCQTATDTPRHGQNQTVRGELALALMAAEERVGALLEDRGWLGRELHNRVLSSLNALRLTLQVDPRKKTENVSGNARPGDFVIKQIDQVAHDLRRLIRQLESGTVRKFSLASELKLLVATYEPISSLTIKLDIQRRAVEVLTQEEERELFTIAREALSNCVRHAKASHVTIALRTRRARVAFTICDDGRGFSASDRQTAGYGLTDMAARTKKLGWRLHIRSQIGRGTLITAEYALQPVLSAV